MIFEYKKLSDDSKIDLIPYSRGGHVIYTYFEEKRIKDNFTRLFKEAQLSLETAEYLKANNIKKIDFVDLDFNPDPKHKSNQVLRSAVGMIEGMGYKTRTKPHASSATYAADKVCK